MWKGSDIIDKEYPGSNYPRLTDCRSAAELRREEDVEGLKVLPPHGALVNDRG